MAYGSVNVASGTSQTDLDKKYDKTGGTISGNVTINGNVEEGRETIASGRSAHSEGEYNTASGNASHTQGGACIALQYGSHAEGMKTIAGGKYILKSISVDANTKTITFDTTYEGHSTAFSKLKQGIKVHALSAKYTNYAVLFTVISVNTTNNSIVVEGDLTDYTAGEEMVIIDETLNGNTSAAHAEGNRTIASGSYSHTEGVRTKASGNASHAEGELTTASGIVSHAEGSSTIASAMCSHAEGRSSIASGEQSHAEGDHTEASGNYSHAEGGDTTASGNYSHAGGRSTKASGLHQTAIGAYNKESTGTTDKFIIGNGTSNTARSNCLRVTNTNGVYSNSTYKSSGADYAEMFEWLNGNAENEDRKGLFVTLDGDKIRTATPQDDYILGIVSACPSVCGDVNDDTWGNMYLTTIFGMPILEKVKIPERTDEIKTINENGEEITKTIIIEEAHTEIRQKLNPEYDNTQKYIPRSERPEWAAVGMLGKLVAIDDGSCEKNGWCTVGNGGVATKSEKRTKFRVMSRLDENHIKVLILS